MAFMIRNPQMILQNPEGCSLSRRKSFNETNVNLFFENLELFQMPNSQMKIGYLT
jgi:hypothetical protein